MDWWQIALIMIGAIIVGLLLGGIVSYLIARLLKQPLFNKGAYRAPSTFEEPPLPPAAEEHPESAAPRPMAQLLKNPFVKKEKEAAVEEQPEAAEPEQIEPVPEEASAIEPEISKVASGQPSSVMSTLFVELENNRKIATKPPTDKLVPFQTKVWDANRDGAQALPASLREDLGQAYVDMRLANSIVWLSAELGRRSPNLDESYTKLCTNIATRLNRVTPLLKEGA